jgi:Cu/Zn superoxide dismutase
MTASTSAAGAGAAGMAATTAPATGAAGMPATAASTAGTGGAQAPASITGSASFASNASGVNLTVMVSGCQSGKQYPIHVHQGMSCESAMAQGGHWDMTRGEGIPNIACGGRMGATMVSRPKTDATTAWSVGDGSATDVIGHVVVIHDADDPTQRIACGVIVKN